MWPGMPFSAFFSSATNWVTYFRRQCSSERTGKCRISIGYQPTYGAGDRSPNASWFPLPTRTSGTARWADFECVLSGCGWNDGVQRRTVIRSAKNGVAVGPRDEVAPGAANDAVAHRNDRENLLEAPGLWPPELVGIGVEHPVRTEVGRCQPRHPRDPLALAKVVT